MAESENTLAESPWPSQHDRIREYFGRITMAESEWYGRVNMAESENTLVETPWPNPNRRSLDDFGRVRIS